MGKINMKHLGTAVLYVTVFIAIMFVLIGSIAFMINAVLGNKITSLQVIAFVDLIIFGLCIAEFCIATKE